VKELRNRGALDSTVFAVFADHGHVDTVPERAIDLDPHPFPAMLENLLYPTARRVLDRVQGNVRVGRQYDEGGSHPNVIFVPQFGLANVYVAGNLSSSTEPDWKKAPSLSDLEPLVNQLFDAYVKTKPRIVAKMLVRVPGSAGPSGGFDGSTYWVVPDTYRHDNSCQGRCTLANQLQRADTLSSQSLDGKPGWEFSEPDRRLKESISVNSGDIVLLANLTEGFQFGAGLKAQHGSLTSRDALVPVAFAYPRASGTPDQDDTIKSLLQLFGGSSARLTAPSEALGLRTFFLTPAPSSPTGR
jgi:hypothetical protein